MYVGLAHVVLKTLHFQTKSVAPKMPYLHFFFFFFLIYEAEFSSNIVEFCRTYSNEDVISSLLFLSQKPARFVNTSSDSQNLSTNISVVSCSAVL
jgi:hypothetical protein